MAHFIDADGMNAYQADIFPAHPAGSGPSGFSYSFPAPTDLAAVTKFEETVQQMPEGANATTAMLYRLDGADRRHVATWPHEDLTPTQTPRAEETLPWRA